MTLIASTLNHKMPILLSDLLWSSKEVPKEIRLPTNSFDLTPYLNTESEEKPVKLGQKMYFINNNVCIIFAGLSNEILVFLKVIKDTFKDYKQITIKDIHSFLKSYKNEINFKESAFFITHIKNLKTNSIKVSQFYYPSETNEVDIETFNVKEGYWNIMKESNFETTSACGNGTEGFLKMIKQKVLFDTRYAKGDFMRAIQANTILISKLLTLERVNLYTIKQNWGGGFELAFYNGTKFEKIDKIAYVINHCQFDEVGNIGLPIPMLIMYYKYMNDILYITALEVFKYIIEETETFINFASHVGEFKTTIFEVEGIDMMNIDEYELPLDFSFNCNKISIGYHINTAENDIYNPAFFNLGDGVQISFKQQHSVKISLLRTFNDDIKNISKKAFSTFY